MIEILANIQNYFFGHYTHCIFFIIIFIGGFFAIHIISKYVTHFFDKVDLDRTLEVFIEKIVKI